MNCKYFRDECEKYLNGSLTENDRKDIEIHLESCDECSSKFGIIMLSELVISEEKAIESNPFLSTRIMAQLDDKQRYNSESLSGIVLKRVLRPFLVAAAITLAVILGIGVGNMSSSVYLSQQIPDEIAYMNDAEIESLDLFITE